MTTQPTPHIGVTLAQRAILRYRMEQREPEDERERLERTTAALQVDALLDRVRQPDPCNFCAPAEEKLTPLWLLALGGAVWTALLVIGLLLVAVKFGWIA